MASINFFSESIDFKPPQILNTKRWIKQVIANENYKLADLNFIFCDDEYLYSINMEYLNHDTYTDIITFDNSEVEKHIEGDIFISIDRVSENAQKHQVSFETELRRVIIHGVLHLCGYKDKTKTQSSEMRSKEDEALKLFI